MRKILLLPLILLISSCASSTIGGYNPVVDPQSVEDTAEYNNDVTDCRAIASGNTNTAASVAKGGLISGAIGTATGTLLGLIYGDTVRGLTTGAVIGGVSGGVGGAVNSQREYEAIFKNCLRGRGYNILN